MNSGRPQTQTFTYDGDGNRIKQANPDGTTKLFLGGGAYEVHIDGQTTTVTKYFAIAGQRVMRDSSGLHYLLTDHLGSVVSVLDSSGDLESDERYLPFGGLRDSTGISQTDFAFTGQRNLIGVGLMDYNARFYLPSVGRFISADTIVPNPGSPQALNRFAYVFNNPLTFSDPRGHMPCNGPMGECGDNPSIKYVEYYDEFPLEPPSGLLEESGMKSYEGLRSLVLQENTLWGSDLTEIEAMAIMLAQEVKITALESQSGNWYLDEYIVLASATLYQKHCSAGPWSVDCFNSFWGYFQPIRTANWLNLQEKIINEPLINHEEMGNLFMRTAFQIINSPRLNLGPDAPTGWATIHLEPNEKAYYRAQDISKGPKYNQVYYRYEFDDLDAGPAIFLVLSINQQINFCGGKYCDIFELP